MSISTRIQTIFNNITVKIAYRFFWAIFFGIAISTNYNYFLEATSGNSSTSEFYLSAEANSNPSSIQIRNLPRFKDPSLNLVLDETVFDNYFVIREDRVNSLVSFKLLAITNTISTDNSIDSNLNNRENTPISIDNAFNVSYSIKSNQRVGLGGENRLQPSNQYVFAYDDLLRLRKISRINSMNKSKTSELAPSMVLHLDRFGQVRYLRESIPNLNIHFAVWFNAYGQITQKRLVSDKHLWERDYTYNSTPEHLAKLQTIATYNYNTLIGADVFSYTNSSDGYPQTLISKHNGKGQLLRTVAITPMDSHGHGSKVESLNISGPNGRVKSELMRFWNNHQLFEEWSYIKGGYQRTLYGYDAAGMLQEKTIIDEAGQTLSRHSYDYEVPSELYGLVFIKELTLRTSKESLNFFGNSDSGVASKHRSVFDLYSLLSFYQEHYERNGRSFRRMGYPTGMEIISEISTNTITKAIVDTQNQLILSQRSFLYDRYGRLSSSSQRFPNETEQLIKYFYAGKPLLPDLKDINTPESTNHILLTYNSFYGGQIFWDFVKVRQTHLAKLAPFSLEEQFKKFVALEKKNNAGKQTELITQEAKLVSRLLFLQANKLSKVISYDRQGNLAYYYRFEYRKLGNNILETRFTYYDTPPNLTLNNRRFEAFAPLANTYDQVNTGTNRYSLLNPYLREGGLYEFRELGVDGVNPNKERPRETIVIRHTDTRILPDAKQIYYNPYSGKPEREELIRGPLRTLVRLQPPR